MGQDFLDQMNRKIVLKTKEPAIVSLVPSITEFLLDLGANVVGRTKFCIHPKEQIKNIPIIGGTKNFRFDDIYKLNPDLIIGNKEENYPEGIKRLELDFPVWMSDILTLEDGREMMTSVARICGKRNKGQELVEKENTVLDRLKNTRKAKILYLIWRDPYMAVGKNTYVNSFLSHLGYRNMIKNERYPALSKEQLKNHDPGEILLSSEPFPFDTKHIEEIKEITGSSSIRLVNGEFYSWYGTRILKLASLIDQEAY